MVQDFTGKMRLKKKTDVISKPVSQCVDYIYDHINERITVQTLSGYTGLSVSYLSRVFKQNLGVSVSDYVREKKIGAGASALLRCKSDRHCELSGVFLPKPLYSGV